MVASSPAASPVTWNRTGWSACDIRGCTVIATACLGGPAAVHPASSTASTVGAAASDTVGASAAAT
jgi:hypothetical protein